MEARREHNVLLILSFSLALLLLYVAINTRFSFELSELKYYAINYDMLADAFVSGQVHLKQKVDPGRSNSPDPRDPSTPYPFIPDAIIWDGKYYVQHEPFPALIHVIWKVLTGLPLFSGAAVLLAFFGNLLLLGLLMWKIRDSFLPQSPFWILFYTWVSFGLSGPQLYMVSRPIIYHEAISMGSLFVLSGATVMLYSWTTPRWRTLLIGLSGLLFGAAVACRITLVLYPLCFAFGSLAFSWLRREPFLDLAKKTICFSVPVLFFLAMLMTYNYLRFSSFLDFGRGHVILPWHQDYLYCIIGGNFFRLEHVPYQLSGYLFALPQLISSFPFIGYRDSFIRRGNVYVVRMPDCSIFIMAPFLLLYTLVPVSLRYVRSREPLFLVLTLFAGAPLVVFASLTFFMGATPRYLYDFSPLAFCSIFCSLSVIWTKSHLSRGARRAALVALGLIFILNAYAAVALCLNNELLANWFLRQIARFLV